MLWFDHTAEPLVVDLPARIPVDQAREVSVNLNTWGAVTNTLNRKFEASTEHGHTT